MAKKRPTAEDRELADVFRKLKCGKYKVWVEDQNASLHYFPLARLKPEGGFSIALPNGMLITISPC